MTTHQREDLREYLDLVTSSQTEHLTIKNNRFFRNTGAVAGVFVLVGLAAASILLWIFFAVRRRRRNQRLEHDNAVSATLAAAGFHRTPLDDGDDDPPPGARPRYGSSPDVEMTQRSSSGFGIGTGGSGRTSAYFDNPPQDEHGAIAGGFNPYADYIVPPGGVGYVPARTSSPPPVPSGSGNAGYRDSAYNGDEIPTHISHSASHSAGSYEPLLAAYYKNAANRSSPPPEGTGGDGGLLPKDPQHLTPTTPLASPLPIGENIRDSASVYSSESTGDDRLDPGLRQRLRDETESETRDLRDEEDYSRPVLGVRYSIYLIMSFANFFYTRSVTCPLLQAMALKSHDT